MLKVIAQDFIKPEAVESVMPLQRALVEKNKREKLCIAHDLLVDQKDPGHFIFIEEWPDRAALDAQMRHRKFHPLFASDQPASTTGWHLYFDEWARTRPIENAEKNRREIAFRRFDFRTTRVDCSSPQSDLIGFVTALALS